MDAIQKSIERHQRKLKTKKQPEVRATVSWGCGMGWPEAKDFPTQAEYVSAKRAADPEYAQGHDNTLWMIV